MEMDRRALYNLLRMNWLRDPSLSVQPWQVADYRSMALDQLFSQLETNGLPLDRVSFQALADDFESPEDLVDHLTADLELDAAGQDKIYLLTFELWRKLIPEKLCLSIFCDELDYQIDLFDRDQEINVEDLQDVLANLAVILDENTDYGESPGEVFASISNRCANDLESFLYDFIAEQVDNHNESYAAELLDDFKTYVKDYKWFEFLRIRLIASSDMLKADFLVKDLLDSIEENDTEFNLEVLAFLVQGGDEGLFIKLLQKTTPLLTEEEEFQDLLAIASDYFLRLDNEQQEKAVQAILSKRVKIPGDKPLGKKDADVAQLLSIFGK